MCGFRWHGYCLLGVVLLCGCNGKSSDEKSERLQPDVQTKTVLDSQLRPEENDGVARHGFHFEVDHDCGIDFLYYGNPSPELYMTEQNGGGVAFVDVDQDDRIDVFLPNGSHFDRPADASAQTHGLYRNITVDSQSLRFCDVSHPSGIASTGFGMGCAAADFNNDGFTDLLLCEYGRIRLWENLGDGTYLEISSSSGLSSDKWAVGAAWADLDEDGDLELYVVNYVKYGRSTPRCYTQHVPPVQISCGPVGLSAEQDSLWENLGDGTFLDVSEPSGIQGAEAGKGLAVEIVDLDGDGRLDIFVANDTTQNFLFRNGSNLRFEETALEAGLAFGADGGASSSMGSACADFDGNGRFDLFVTNFENSINDFYSNHSPNVYLQMSALMGLDTTSRPMLAFGTVAADFDLDQHPDLLIANGHIWDLRSLGFGHEYEMTPQLFWNRAGKRFTDVSEDAGPYFREKWLGRAVALGDIDNDGDADMVVSNLLKKTAVVVNKSERQGSSVRLRVIGRNAARQPLGARVVCRVGDKTCHYHIPSGGSFAASHDSRILLSVGAGTKIDELSICWGSTKIETWTDLPVEPSMTLIEGTGSVMNSAGSASNGP